MLECLILGDSIARGVADARRECEQHTQVGITSGRFILDLLPARKTAATTAVISLGVNDSDDVTTEQNLREVRARVQAETVYWLLPGIKDRVRNAIRAVAAENGDRLIDTGGHTGADHLHPTRLGYRAIARQTEGEAGNQLASAEWSRPAEREAFAERYSAIEADPPRSVPGGQVQGTPRPRMRNAETPARTRNHLTPEQRRTEVQEAAVSRRRAKLDRIRQRDPALLACASGPCATPARHAARGTSRQGEPLADRHASRHHEAHAERRADSRANNRADNRAERPAKAIVRAERSRPRSAG